LASIADKPVGIYELGASSFLASTAGAGAYSFLGDSLTAAYYFSSSLFSTLASCSG
jgi:hypothetical protein